MYVCEESVSTKGRISDYIYSFLLNFESIYRLAKFARINGARICAVTCFTKTVYHLPFMVVRHKRDYVIISYLSYLILQRGSRRVKTPSVERASTWLEMIEKETRDGIYDAHLEVDVLVKFFVI